MSNPDKSSINLDALTVGTPTAILFFLILLVLFIFKESIPTFRLVLWLAFPIIGYFVCVIVNIINQFVSCKKVDANKAFLGGLPSLGTIFLALTIASIPYCRIPVASVFTPLFVGKTVDVVKNSTVTSANSLKNSNSKECCTPKMTLESIESQFPVVAGISYGFYMMFAILFGVTIGSGISTIC